MRKLIAVIGAGYGDEGKGLLTDYFANECKTGFVVRHNSSAQAAHTVQLRDGTRHVFSHFGSGTFVGLPTFLGEKFVVHPLLFRDEHRELIDLGYKPKVYVHSKCMVTTPYDMIINQMLEHMRGDSKHGSCGVGYNETIIRHLEYPELSSYVYDDKTFWIHTKQRLQEIKDNLYENRFESLTITSDTIENLYNAYYDPQIFDVFIDAYNYFLENVEIVEDYNLLNTDNVIFEGAQGLQLDQHGNNFPHVTRSNTGIKDVIEIVNKLDNVEQLDVVYVTRSYTTKHGAGPLPFEEEFPQHLLNIDQTNKPNEFQGTLRYAPLNLNTYHDLVMKDIDATPDQDYLINCLTAFTCLDQKPTDVVLNGVVHHLTSYKMEQLIANFADYVSYGPTREDVQSINT